jgi:prepilin-type N-terminal cleavage/methylation domain-containing protein
VNHKGFTLVELIVVMAMMALLGSTLLTVVGTGGNQYRRIHESYRNENEARIALSYITVKIRQHDVMMDDVTHAVSVQDTPVNALRIQQTLDTWWSIEMDGNTLIEKAYNSGDPDNPASADIAEGLDSVSFASALFGRAVEIDITYTVEENTKHLTQTVFLRAH